MFLFTCVLLLDVNEMLALGSSEELSQFLTLLVAASACQPPKPVALDVTGGAEGFKLFMLGERAPLSSSSYPLGREEGGHLISQHRDLEPLPEDWCCT